MHSSTNEGDIFPAEVDLGCLQLHEKQLLKMLYAQEKDPSQGWISHSGVQGPHAYKRFVGILLTSRRARTSPDTLSERAQEHRATAKAR